MYLMYYEDADGKRVYTLQASLLLSRSTAAPCLGLASTTLKC